MNYYTIHDEDNNRLGFIPQKDSPKNQPTSGDQPTRVFASSNPEDPKDSALSWIITYFLIIIFSCFWLVLISEIIGNSGSSNQPG